MSRATIRSAVVAYTNTEASLVAAGLLNVHPAKPRNWNPTEWRSDTFKSTANGYVFIEGEIERRGALGKKYIEYTVGLVFLFRTWDDDIDAAMAAYDGIVEAIKARLRGDHRLGQSSTVIFQAAETLLESATDDLVHQAQESEAWGVVRFDVSEWITA